MNRSAFVRALTLAVLLTAPAAVASRGYPPEIRRVTGACATPVCIVCHTSSTGGTGTAERPFAMTLKSEGLTGNGNLTALGKALAAIEATPRDSDGDGVDDLTELRQGSNPSNSTSTSAACSATGGDGGTEVVPPGEPEPLSYGCGALPPSAAFLLVMTVLAAGWRPK